jgi:hypothetical protein
MLPLLIVQILKVFSKLFSKGLAMRLAPCMNEIIRANQTAFIKGRHPRQLQNCAAHLPLAPCSSHPLRIAENSSRQGL